MENVSSPNTPLTGAQQTLPKQDIPARGYLRHLWLRCFGTGGNKTAGVAGADFPFSYFDGLAFFDVGGGYIFNPMTGYNTYLINKYGGYVFQADPTLHPDYSADLIAFNFALRVPFEISFSDGLGALSNQNSKSKYKFQPIIAASTTIYTTPLTANGTVNMDIYTELWSQPPDRTDKGVGINNRPPLLGTTQYWTVQTVNVNAGNQSIELDRRGNQDRVYILVFRDATGARQDGTMAPDPIRFVWDSREQYIEPLQYRRQAMVERYGNGGIRTALDKGVYVYDLAHDVLGHPGGMDDGHLWYRTKTTSRLEFRGNLGVAGTVTILHNDVAPVAVDDQYSDVSGTGGAADQTV
jgi:hypothetical protein